MPGIVDAVAAAHLDSTVVRIVLAAALGLFLGLEREWEQKSAGIRTFSPLSLLGAVSRWSGRTSSSRSAACS